MALSRLLFRSGATRQNENHHEMEHLEETMMHRRKRPCCLRRAWPLTILMLHSARWTVSEAGSPKFQRIDDVVTRHSQKRQLYEYGSSSTVNIFVQSPPYFPPPKGNDSGSGDEGACIPRSTLVSPPPGSASNMNDGSTPQTGTYMSKDELTSLIQKSGPPLRYPLCDLSMSFAPPPPAPVPVPLPVPPPPLPIPSPPLYLRTTYPTMAMPSFIAPAPPPVDSNPAPVLSPSTGGGGSGSGSVCSLIAAGMGPTDSPKVSFVIDFDLIISGNKPATIQRIQDYLQQNVAPEMVAGCSGSSTVGSGSSSGGTSSGATGSDGSGSDGSGIGGSGSGSGGTRNGGTSSGGSGSNGSGTGGSGSSSGGSSSSGSGSGGSDSGVQNVIFDVVEDTTADPYCDTCTNLNVNTDIYYNGGDANSAEDDLYNTLIEHCDGIRSLEGVDETFDPCPTVVIYPPGEDGGSVGGGTGGGDNGGGGSTGGGDGSGSGGSGGGSTGGSGGDGSGGDGSGGDGSGTGGSGSGSGGDVGSGGTGNGDGSGTGGDGSGSGGSGNTGGGAGTGNTSANGGGTTNSSDVNAGGDGVAGLGEQQQATADERTVSPLGILFASLAALLLLWLLCYAVRRSRRERSDSLKHEVLNEGETFIRGNASNDSPQATPPRLTKVVAEDDSLYSNSFGGFPPGYSEDDDDHTVSTMHRDVHFCSSATCELCEHRRQTSTQFIPTDMPRASSLPNQSNRPSTIENAATI